MIRGLVFLLLLTQMVPVTAETAESAEIAAVSKCGQYRLKLNRSSQTPSPWDSDVAAVSLSFGLQISQTNTPQFLWGRPKGVYIENEDPLISALVEPNRDVAKNKHFGSTDNMGFSVTVSNLEIGEPQAELQSLVLVVTLVRVKTWENVRFDDVTIGTNDYLKCGPFQLEISGEEKRAMVLAASFSKFKAEKEEYKQRVPLKFLNHSYGINHISIRDAKRRSLFNTGGFGSGGFSSGSFVIPSPSKDSISYEHQDPTTYPVLLKMSSAPEGLAIEYPLSVEVRLPEKYEIEKVVFEFTEIPLPELEKKEVNKADGGV